MLPALCILVKPASSACNMACRYCFYFDVAERRRQAFAGMLPPEKLETLVRNALASVSQRCVFAFQGGEPTLAGLDFYKRLVELQKRCNENGVRIQNSIQTNGLAVDEEWAAFFREHDFLVGLSLDGPADIHNANRPDRRGKDTFNRVMKALHLFQGYGVEFNVLCVVTGRNAETIGSIYRFMMKRNITHLQFIPCLDPLDSPLGGAPWSLSPDQYGKFLIRVWDLWFDDLQKGIYTSVRHIDNWLSLAAGRPAESCNMTGHCSIQLVVEGDGGVYPCDFYVTDEWRLGDVGDPLEELMCCDRAKRFIDVSLPAPGRCRDCRWRVLCRNGCMRERLGVVGDAPLNRFCESYRRFFESRYDRIREACRLLFEAGGRGGQSKGGGR